MGFLQGKRALITGVASQRSIASGIAEAMRREGAELAFTYQNDKLQSRVEKAAAELGSEWGAFAQVAEKYGVSPQQICLAWELTLSDAMIPIPGASRPESVTDSAAAVHLVLDDDDLALLS